MTNLLDDANNRTSELLSQKSQIDLTRAEMAVIIDALLQAEMTLPLLDRRHMALKPIESLRFQQLSLASRLENMMADLDRSQDHAHRQPGWASSWRSTRS